MIQAEDAMRDTPAPELLQAVCRKRTENTMPIGIKLMRSQVLCRAAQAIFVYLLRKAMHVCPYLPAWVFMASLKYWFWL